MVIINECDLTYFTYATLERGRLMARSHIATLAYSSKWTDMYHSQSEILIIILNGIPLQTKTTHK